MRSFSNRVASGDGKERGNRTTATSTRPPDRAVQHLPPLPPPKSTVTKKLTSKYTCEYCDKRYVKESTLLAHMCEPKRRWLQKDEKRVQVGFYAFQRFYKLSAGHKKDKTYEDFVKSSFYNAFVKFGSFVNNVRPLYPDKYIDYVVTSNVKLDHWCREEMYEKYAIELIRKEGVETALERSIQTMVEWAK